MTDSEDEGGEFLLWTCEVPIAKSSVRKKLLQIQFLLEKSSRISFSRSYSVILFICAYVTTSDQCVHRLFSFCAVLSR